MHACTEPKILFGPTGRRIKSHVNHPSTAVRMNKNMNSCAAAAAVSEPQVFVLIVTLLLAPTHAHTVATVTREHLAVHDVTNTRVLSSYFNNITRHAPLRAFNNSSPLDVNITRRIDRMPRDATNRADQDDTSQNATSAEVDQATTMSVNQVVELTSNNYSQCNRLNATKHGYFTSADWANNDTIANGSTTEIRCDSGYSLQYRSVKFSNESVLLSSANVTCANSSYNISIRTFRDPNHIMAVSDMENIVCVPFDGQIIAILFCILLFILSAYILIGIILGQVLVLCIRLNCERAVNCILSSKVNVILKFSNFLGMHTFQYRSITECAILCHRTNILYSLLQNMLLSENEYRYALDYVIRRFDVDNDLAKLVQCELNVASKKTYSYSAFTAFLENVADRNFIKTPSKILAAIETFCESEHFMA